MIIKLKIYIKFAIIIFFLFLYASSIRAEDRIVAIVNDELITESELKDKNGLSYRKLSYLIEKKLQLQIAKKKGIVVQPEEASIMKKNTSEEENKEAIEQLTIFKLLNREIKSRISISDRELEEYYTLNKELFLLPEEVRVGYIFIPIKTSDYQENTILLQDRVNDILSYLKKGASFKDIPAHYYEDINIQVIEDLGFIKRGDLLKEIDMTAFNLGEGEISEVIRTPAGFYILKVLEKRLLKYKTFEESIDLIKDKVFQEKSENLYKEWLYDIKTASFIEIKI